MPPAPNTCCRFRNISPRLGARVARLKPPRNISLSLISMVALTFQVNVLVRLVVVGLTSTEVQLDFLQPVVPADHRNEELGEVVMHIRRGVEVTGRIHTDHLVVERSRRLQDVRVELRGIAAELVARCATHFTRREVEETALEVQLDHVLLVLGAGLQRRGTAYIAVVRRRRVAANTCRRSRSCKAPVPNRSSGSHRSELLCSFEFRP